MRLAAIVLALLSAWTGPAPRSDDAAREQQKAQCSTCKDTGLVPCKSCAKDPCKQKHEPKLCSIAARCKACGGTQRERCSKCKTEPDYDFAARRAEIAAWLAATAAPIDAFMGRPLAHAQSAHFVLTWDVPKVDAPGGATLHGAMHLYVDRLEEFYERFCKDVPCADADFSSKTAMMVWAREADQTKASPHFTLQPSDTESKLMGRAPVVSIFYDKGHLHEESELHQALVHHAAHCLLSNAWDGVWPGNIKGGWIDEGIAHWYETALFGGVRHYCYAEQDSIQDFKFGRWEGAVRAAVDAGETPPFVSLASRNTTAMSPEERMFAWSYCDYLLRAKPDKFAAVARLVKQKKPAGEVVQTALGITPFQFEEDWKAWVKATYALKPGKK